MVTNHLPLAVLNIFIKVFHYNPRRQTELSIRYETQPDIFVMSCHYQWIIIDYSVTFSSFSYTQPPFSNPPEFLSQLYYINSSQFWFRLRSTHFKIPKALPWRLELRYYDTDRRFRPSESKVRCCSVIIQFPFLHFHSFCFWIVKLFSVTFSFFDLILFLGN
jgi:hypothetical protein